MDEWNEVHLNDESDEEGNGPEAAYESDLQDIAQQLYSDYEHKRRLERRQAGKPEDDTDEEEEPDNYEEYGDYGQDEDFDDWDGGFGFL